MQEISVSTLVRYLKNKLDSDHNIQSVLVVGEISNFHRHYSGHLYFTLKDETAQISCVMFKSSANSLKFEPKTGDKVLLTANTSIFETSGQLQLYVLKMSPYGLGDLYAQYEELKNRLTKDGYFDENHKIELSKTYLDKVAVLVGDHSAAMSDIKTQFARRWPLCKVDYYPVLVQGKEASSQIIDQLLKVDQKDYDVIILARGGGSFEDLFCFNDENLVKAIYQLKTFIITGIGHEQDFTLADFVADLRAPTPTATVELITPNIKDVEIELEDYQQSLQDLLTNKLNNISSTYDFYVEKLIHYQEKLNNIDNQINSSIKNIQLILSNKIKMNRNEIEVIEKDLDKSVNYKYTNTGLILKRYATLLEAYSSKNVLSRGYTLVFQDGQLIKKASSLKEKEFEIQFYDQKIKAIRKE